MISGGSEVVVGWGPIACNFFKWSSLEYLEFRLVVECSNLVKWMMN